MMSNFGCMLYQKGKDVKMLSKSETRNVTMNLYGNEEKCIGTQLCGPQTCVPMFLFVILSFLPFSLRRELRENAYLCRAIVRNWTLDCPKVDTCVNRGDSFSDGYVSGAIFVRK